MSRHTLQQWLLADKNFRLAFGTLEEDAVRSQFPALESSRSEHAMKADWSYLLLCASILAPSDLPAAEEKALRIAQSALVDPECTEMERDAALVLLDALSNRRAITLAEQRGRVIANIEERLGITHRIDWMRRAFEHRIDLANGQFLFANKFQRRFWAAAASNAWLSVSAPTSAGKSFILAQWLTDKLSAGRFHRIVYIAPTRALVQQVERDLRESLAEAEVGGVGVSSIPFRPEAPATEREILVFTQERLHYYLQSFPDTVIDALIVDEAHKLGDSHRGVLLQDVIEQVTAVNRHATVLFTAPLTENPETLLSEAPEEVSRASLQSDDATVSQNLLWLEPVAGETKQWELSLRREGRSSSLGYLTAPKRLSTIKSKLAVLAILTDTDDGGILVYANGAAQAEDFAEEIARRLPDWPRSKPIRALDELCDETIHKEYKLRAVLRKGVAFHYGNMPLLLRTAIEDLFREGHIRYLVCTSTLVEGVNLPCRNIVIRAPKKGKRVDMAPADFWNLAGRAGRWGKEFQGNVICVDTQDKEAWGDTLPSGRGRYRVERTTDRLLKDEKMLLEYITQRAPADRAENNQDLESAISYLTSIRYQYGSLLQAPWHGRLEPAKLERIDGALAAALSEIDIPPEWIRRHAGISPFAMRRMIEGLLGLKVSIDNFLPIDPETPEASKQYARIFEMMSHHMTTAFGQGGRCHALGILTTNWMLGYPIKRLISERIGWNRRKKIEEDVGTTIRKTLEDVEQIARFQAPRYLACYSDIARFTLALQDEVEKAELIPDLTLSLEFGVRGPVQLGLMAMGLSRSSTLAISEVITEQLTPDEISRAQTNAAVLTRALSTLDLTEISLPALVREEVERAKVTLLQPRND